MNTLKALAACVSLGFVANVGLTGLQAQSASANCGVLTWSTADQKHSVLPCTAPTPQSPEGTPTCGITTYSNAEQKHTGLPCPSTTGANRKDACTLLIWSQSEQRYASTPCDMPNSTGLTAPIHFGD